MNQIFNIDKLHIQFKYEFENQLDFSITNLTDDFQIIINSDKIKYSSKSYKDFHNIFYEDKFIGVLLSKQKQKSKTIQIHFTKEILYTDFKLLLRFYDDFVSLFGFYFDNFCRLEIALNELNPFRWTEIFKIQSNLIDSYQYNQALFKSNSKAKILIHSLYNNKLFIVTNKANNPEGQKRISNSVAIYLKTNLEDWQIDFYRQNGLLVEKHLYRTEVRLFRSFFYNLQRRNKGYDFKDIFDVNNQIALFDYAIGDKLDFKDLSQTYYDHNRNKKHPIIKLYKPISGTNTIKPIVYPSKPIKVNDNRLETTVKAFRSLMGEYLINPSTTYENAIIEIINNGRFDYNYEIKKFINKGISPNSFDFLNLDPIT